jgi:hypothetical protein
MKTLFVLAICLLIGSAGFARLGDTREQAEERYGVEKDPPRYGVPAPLLENAKDLLFVYGGWKIRCAVLLATDGNLYVVKEEYSKIWNTDVWKAGGSPVITDLERDAILRAEAGNQTWRNKLLGSPGPSLSMTLSNQFAQSLGFNGASWIRDDGAVATFPLGMSTMILELPQALKYEAQLKAIKERKTRAAIPAF